MAVTYGRDFIGPVYSGANRVPAPQSTVNYAYRDAIAQGNSNPLPKSSNTSSGSGGSRSSSSSSSNDSQDRARAEAEAAQERLRGDISSGWDSYISGLDSQLEGFNTQRGSQEGIVNSQYNQGINTLGLQRDQGLQSLDADRQAAQKNQASTLRDISGNIRNAFQAGNVFLGARGAGDSSAADQYSYALNKMGTRERSDVMNNTASILGDVEARETNLNNIYNTETNNLSQQRDMQIQQVALWFSEAQNQLKQMKAQGQLSKSQDLASLSRDLLNQALSQVNQIEQANMNRKQALDQWAMGVSNNIGQLKSNMQSVSDVSYSLPGADQIAGGPQVDQAGNINTSLGGGGGIFSRERDPNRLFG